MAASYFEESYRYGNPDAANHLGFLHLHGYYPNKSADPVRVNTFFNTFISFQTNFFYRSPTQPFVLTFQDLALQYFSYAAARNQFDAGISLAYLHHKGTPRTNRSIEVAVEYVYQPFGKVILIISVIKTVRMVIKTYLTYFSDGLDLLQKRIPIQGQSCDQLSRHTDTVTSEFHPTSSTRTQ